MKWWPDVCCPGDMVRASIGSVKHYGVFISEQEIIQFGPPPIARTAIDDSSICVCAATAEAFSCGYIIEKAILDKSEKRRRLPPQKTIEIARSRMGETGYNLLHNNCEHFAYECVFGIKKSTQEDEARERWNSRPVMDVYLAPLPDEVADQHFLCKEREEEIRNTANEKLRMCRLFDWQVLLYAANRSFGLKESDLTFQKTSAGKWKCDRFWFSLSHTDGAVLVGVSNEKIGVDIENTASWERKPYADPATEKKLRRRICTSGEAASGEPDLMHLWTLKESIFKCYGRSFIPTRIDTDKYRAETFQISAFPEMLMAVCGEQLDHVRFYQFDDGHARSVHSEMIRNGKRQ